MGVWGMDWFTLDFDLMLTLPPFAETGVRQGLLVKPSELVNPLLVELVVVVTTSIVVFLFRDCNYPKTVI